MKNRNHILKLQIISTYSLIATAALYAVFTLGFMSNFYILFMDGTDEMYNFYKSIQVLNTAVFKWAITLLVLAIMLLPFELHKKKAGLFGMIYISFLTLLCCYKLYRIYPIVSLFRESYGSLDFSILDNYSQSFGPFNLIFLFSVLSSLLLFCLTLSGGINLFSNRKGGFNED